MSTRTPLEEELHEQLSTYGLKEDRAVGQDTDYYEGYCDALEWVLNKAMDTEDEDEDDDCDAVHTDWRFSYKANYCPACGKDLSTLEQKHD